MSALVTIGNPTAVHEYADVSRAFNGGYHSVLTNAETIHLSRVESITDVALRFSIPEFQCDFSAPISDVLPAFHDGKVLIKAWLDEGAVVLLTLKGSFSQEDDKFHIEETDLKIQAVRNRARTDFVTSTFWAMLSLADSVRLWIPTLDRDLTLKFRSELSAISEMLQRRLLAYRTLIVERATGNDFELPSFISGDQVKNIALIYYAIVQHSFVWPVNYVDYGWPADQNVLESFIAANKSSVITLGFPEVGKELFGSSISLGPGYLTIQDKVIENYETVLEELARGDGHMVRVRIKSSSGTGVYDLPNAPHLPSTPWDTKLQQLIDLESQLDSRLITHYNNLAASTLAGLTDAEKKEITQRPYIDDDAFPVN
jgi:hypothetical protein